MKWRSKVNYELNNEYKKIFNKINRLIFLKVPNFECVYKWRLLQEKKMSLNSNKVKTMSNVQIKNFIMYYERITLQKIKDLRNSSDITERLDKKHRLNTNIIYTYDTK